MPIVNKEKYNSYMKEYRRNKKKGLPNDNKTTIILKEGLPNHKNLLSDDIYYYENTGKPITMTLRDGSIIYLKKRITKP